MAEYRSRSVVILVILLLVAGIGVYSQGVNWGIDVKGGSSFKIRVEATQVDILFDNYSEGQAENILENLRDEFPRTKIIPVRGETEKVKVEIGERVPKERITPLISDKYEIKVTHKVSNETIEEVIEALRLRVDPYGTLGAQFKSIGDRYINFEVPVNLEEARSLLGEVGHLEIFVEDNLVVRGDQITNVRSPTTSPELGPHIPFTWNKQAAKDWKNATEGKAGHPGVIYLDRPADSVILFGDEFKSEFDETLEISQRLEEGEHKDNRFRLKPARRDGSGEWFNVQVPAFYVEGEIGKNLESHLIKKKNSGEIQKIILLGNDFEGELSERENLKLGDNVFIPIENNQVESDALTQLMNITGLESYPNIQEGIAGKEIEELVITSGSLEEARELRNILAQSLPAEVEIESEERMPARLGEGFDDEVLLAGVFALLAVGLIVFIRYRELKIALPLMFTVASEVIITLGIVSVIPSTIITMGIAEIGGLIAVIGFGVDNQVMITDEVLYGGTSEEKQRLSIERRTQKAYSIIFASVSTTIAAMAALATVGLGAMRGFAIVTIIGSLISIGISRPAYASILGTLLEDE